MLALICRDFHHSDELGCRVARTVTWIIAAARRYSQARVGPLLFAWWRGSAHVMAVPPSTGRGRREGPSIPGSKRNASKPAVSFVTAMPSLLQMNRLHSQELSSNLLPFSRRNKPRDCRPRIVERDGKANQNPLDYSDEFKLAFGKSQKCPQSGRGLGLVISGVGEVIGAFGR